MRTRRVELRFSGARNTTAALTWPQRTMWVAHHRLAPHDCALLNVAFTAASPGRAVDEVLADLRTQVERHDVLRTTYKVDEHGSAWQVVCPDGTLPVDLIDAGDAPDATAAEAETALSAAPFDLVTAPPVRAALVIAGQAVTHVVLVGHHIALDGWSVVRLGQRLAEGGEDADGPVLQPAEQAAAEASADGEERMAAALEYWACQLNALPPALFPVRPGRGEQPRFKVARLESAALARALPALCRTHRTTGSTVLLAGVLALVAVKTGNRRCGMQVAVANRDTPETFDAVGCLYQEVTLSVDLAGARHFSDVVARTWAATRDAHAHSRYDPLRLYRLVERINAERGVSMDRTCVFNDERISPVGRPSTGAPAATRVDWLPEQHRDRGGRFHLWVDSSPVDTVVVRLMGDTAALSSGEISGFLLGLESALVTAAERELPLSELTALAQSADHLAR